MNHRHSRAAAAVITALLAAAPVAVYAQKARSNRQRKTKGSLKKSKPPPLPQHKPTR